MDVPEELQSILVADDGPTLNRVLASAAPALRVAALRAACVLGLGECVRAAVTSRDDVIFADSHAFTSLHHAARGGHVEVLEVLLKNVWDHPVDFRTEDVRLSRLSYLCGDVTPLHLAAASGEAAAVALLLHARADARARDANGWNAADHARGKVPILELLGIVPDSQITAKEYEAATRRRCEECTAHVEPSEFGRLLVEADEGRPEGLRRLLRCGDVKNMRIVSSPLLEAATSLGSAEGLRIIVEVLRSQGKPGHDPEASKELALPGLNDLGPMGFAPLHTAVETGFLDCIAPLLEARADVHLRTADASFQLGQASTVYTEGGRTALHIAVQKGHLLAVDMLLAKGALPEAVDSFGLTPCDLALEGVVLPEGRAAERPKVAALLGIASAPGDAPVELGVEAVRARRAERQRRLRERVAAADARRRAEADAELRRAVRDRYTPLDASLAHGLLSDEALGHDLVAWSVEPGPEPPLKRVCAVGGCRTTDVESPMPGVFVFQLLSEAMCHKIWAETEQYLAQAPGRGLPLPMRHDGGLDLSKVFPELLHRIAEAALPAISALLPQELHGVSLRHAFRTKNFVDREERFARHVDKYAVTLNVCIRRTPNVQGSGVFFFESECSEEPVYRHEHALGLAVLHSSKEWHQTEPLAAGERGSIIMWFSQEAP